MKSSANKANVPPLFSSIVFFVIATLVSIPLISIAQEQNITPKDDLELLNSFIHAKGYENEITFTHENIKQFWIDKTVVSQDDLIKVFLTTNNKAKLESVPLRIQLANVHLTQDCKIDIISSESDLSFTVLNDKSEQIEVSMAEKEQFINDTITSGVFHLVDITDSSFFLQFSSKNSNMLKIKKIILSFSKNKRFLASPGTIHFTKDNLTPKTVITEADANSFYATGKRTRLFAEDRILISDNVVTNSATVKNTGDEPVHIYFGYSPYSEKGERIDNRCIPYKNENTILKVVSAGIDSNKMIVDSYADWKKGCYLALNAKEDLSDFPNTSFIEAEIQELNKIDDTHTEIIFDKPIKIKIEEGTLVRIQSPKGAAQIYTHGQDLQPGEEISFSSKIQRDDSFLKYSSKALCRGVYYVIPFIFSNSLDSGKENTVLIKDFSVSY